MNWYTGDTTYDTLLTLAFVIVALTVVGAAFIQTPYGRFASDNYGVNLDPRLGWFLMELPATVFFLYFYFQGPNAFEPFPLFILFVWVVHYANRGWIMPALMRVPRDQKSSFSLMVVMIGWVVTSLHGYLNAVWASTYSPLVGWDAFTHPAVIAGIVIYYLAFVMNLQSDHIVRNLRSREEVENGIRKYRMPRGGLFKYVTNPSYFTELVFWFGFALMNWSLAGVYILAISAANLLPRAIATHKWYKEKFADYPTERKILIPGVW